MSVKSLQIAPGLELNWTDENRDLWIGANSGAGHASFPINDIPLPFPRSIFQTWALQFISANPDKIKEC